MMKAKSHTEKMLTKQENYTMDTQKYQNFHFIGIGGSGMSGLAKILKAKRKKISGSDEKSSPITLSLQRGGISLAIGHNANNIPKETQIIIYSPAVPENNPEKVEAQRRGLPQLSYPEAVGLLTKEKKTIAVCGTHGKTTTTALITIGLLAAKKDPSVLVGASIPELHNHSERHGKGDYFVLESCEYKRGFLNYHPQIIVITNIEADHLDYYKDLKDYKSAFAEFITKLPKNGLIIANYDDANVRSILKKSEVKIVWYGTRKADYQLKGNDIIFRKKTIAKLNLRIPGQHNLINSTAAIALLSELKLPLTKIIESINKYQGSSRRFESKGTIGKTVLIDDYGHHPTEIKVTLKAAREKFGRNKKILCIFQPHQYSRTAKLLEGFSKAFQDADEVIISNILAVRDSSADIKSINAETLVRKIKKHHPSVRFGDGIDKTGSFVKKHLQNYDVIITMGAGDVWKVIDGLKNSAH